MEFAKMEAKENAMRLRAAAMAVTIFVGGWSCGARSFGAEGRAQMKEQSSGAHGQAQASARGRVHAESKITVHNSQAKPYDQSAGPALVEIELSETFAGDIDGESTVRALEIRREDRSASLVSMQRFTGKIGGREGTFVLQGSETLENGKISAKWFVVPGSGTGDLSGLRGEGGFQGEFGKGSDGTLDYWFE